MEDFVILLSLIWSVLCIVLFFKVWNACNNIQRLTDKYAPNREIRKTGKSTLETREDIDKWLKEE